MSQELKNEEKMKNIIKGKKGTRALSLNHIKNLADSKRSVSIIIGYVLLVVIAISLALLVYVWLKNYLPGVSEECPDTTSLMIADYSCSGNNINIKFRNTGLFSIYGFIARVKNQTGGFFYELKTGESIENYFGISPYEKGLKPNDEENVLLSFTPYARILELQVQPFVLGEKNKPVLCENIITQRIQNCEGSGDISGNNIILNWNYDKADIGYRDNEYDWAIQMKWDIASIPNNININDAKLCFYVGGDIMEGSVNNIKLYRINEENWEESTITINNLNSQTLLDEVTTVHSSTTEGNIDCFDVTLQLRNNLGRNYFSLRFSDSVYVPETASLIASTSIRTLDLGRRGGSSTQNYIVYRSKESSDLSILEPYLNITYT